jgi:hypothetical protein
MDNVKINANRYNTTSIQWQYWNIYYSWTWHHSNKALLIYMCLSNTVSSSNWIHRQQAYISTTWITIKTILEIRVFKTIQNLLVSIEHWMQKIASYFFTQSTVTSQVHLAIYATNVTVVPSSAKYMHYPNNSKHWKRRKIVNTSVGSFSDRLSFQCEISCTIITVSLPQSAGNEVQKLLWHDFIFM